MQGPSYAGGRKGFWRRQDKGLLGCVFPGGCHGEEREASFIHPDSRTQMVCVEVTGKPIVDPLCESGPVMGAVGRK